MIMRQVVPGNQTLLQPKAGCACGGSCPRCQAKSNLNIGAPDDAYEREADTVADRVMRMAGGASPVTSAASGLQRKCAACEKEDGESLLQTKAESSSASTQGHAATAPASVHHVLSSPGKPLESSLQQDMGQRFGHDFSRVRVHADEQAAASADALAARAYTVGPHVVFGRGQYAPHTSEGRHLLAHELTHVMQQSGSSGQVIQRAETDTEDSCGGLSDIKSVVNNHVNNTMAEARKASSGSTDKLIDEVYEHLGEGRMTHPGRTKIEDFLESQLKHGKQVRQPAQADTKYEGMMLGLWAVPGVRVLGATIKVNNICIGTDKLGHFFQQGYEYFGISNRQGKGNTAAEEYGIKTEIGKFGLATTGVFSNADLVANRQGMSFYDKLSKDHAMTFDIAGFVSNQWNEESNPNLYSNVELIGGERVWSNLLTDTWEGEFTNERDSRLNVPVTMNLRCPHRKKLIHDWVLRGDYSFEDENGGTVNGKINGIVSPREVEAAPSLSKVSAIEGVRIKFGWSEGGAKGRGEWISGGESLLNGTWGRGTSEDDAGLWWAMRK